MASASIYGKLDKTDKAILALNNKSSDEEVKQAFSGKLFRNDPIWQLREHAKIAKTELKLVRNKSRIRFDIFVPYETDDQYFIGQRRTAKPRYSKFSDASIIKMLESREMVKLLNKYVIKNPKRNYNFELRFTPSSIKKVQAMSQKWIRERGYLLLSNYKKVFRIQCTAIVEASPKFRQTQKTILNALQSSFWFQIGYNIMDHLRHQKKYRGELSLQKVTVPIDPIYKH